ncbi:MASE4 domain-containing protein [Bradyrhizobium sp. Pha-3]|uniref:MASE4 domain-containing protein n=1 Tax=Bradyrhizobium sp. Pha-3 TaxID=208375 RepID=UPI0035D46659
MESSSAGTDRERDRDFPIAIAAIPASLEQRRLALAFIVAVLGIAAIVAPFAGTQLPRIDVFVPVVQTVLAVADLITAVLLFSQYTILPQRALLAVASAYLCSAWFAFLQTLTFPGAYAPAGLLGDGFNSPAWLFILWHVTFALGILIYALLKNDREPSIEPRASTRAIIGLTVLGVTIVVTALSWIALAWVDKLPAFYVGGVIRQTNLGNQANVGLLLWYGVALGVLLTRRRTILDTWLVVTLVAWMPNFLVAALASSVRFSLGWYAARGFALVASFMLLTVLLTEMMVLYSRLANAFSLLRRERTNRLMSVDAATAAIAHEVRTPLGAIALNASTAIVQLRSASPPLQEVGDILKDIETDSLRASEVLVGVRSLFKAATDNRGRGNLGMIAARALALSEQDFLNNEVSVATDIGDTHVQVDVDQTQLQQVILNLIRNAIEAMGSVEPAARRLRLATRVDEKSTVALSIQDAGEGIPAGDRDRVFDAFFTTKSSGMGLGLAISRTIIENHDGVLRLIRSGPEGSTFEIALPRAKNNALADRSTR